ncbi:hypothetical protein S40285_00932 [Stachybotrys chlorohalonatus IBT 40285]|uniref:ATP-dependent RNA helicase n=1 Tax=Stachybotrys chlorohalonatus (strain IBT 40285) TaxID=1283841 RepID=A0A084QUN1_STAC4|nr:hypothetical protein S40285_00932 [Stachybotrys chlorohalonata IBT 40285]
MAEDGMLLNFEFSAEPVKRQVKFTGGRWRDRKSAQRAAKHPSSPAARPEPSSIDVEGDLHSSKRRKLAETGVSRHRLSDAGLENKHATSQPRRPTNDEGIAETSQRPKQGSSRAAQGKQVVSRLFSFNPAQTSAPGEDKEWTAPEPTNAPLSDVANFGELTISSRLVEELGKMNLERPTAIQKKVIPHMLASSADAFVQAETGSGKTFSYLLPILHRVLLLSNQASGKQIHRDSGLFAIIVAPTRELAKQTYTVLEQLIKPFPWLVSTAITGGESKKAEKARIRKGVNFLVATPGRLADHIDNTKALNLGTVRWLILDEGDRLMDLGFEEDLKKAVDALRQVSVTQTTPDGTPLGQLPERRVTILCSATMKMNVQKLGEMSLADATFLAAEKTDEEPQEQAVHKAPAQLHQSYIVVPSKLRLVTLIAFLRSIFSRRGHTMKAIVFMSCADTVDFHYELLRQTKKTEESISPSKASELIEKTVSTAAYINSPASPEVMIHRMHGSLSQPVRTATLRSFATTKLPSLLCTTDVSSRGLDIPDVDMVVEYDPAFSFPDHIHRVGRTARAGRSGASVLFLLPGTEEGYIELLKSSANPSPKSYETVLEKGLLNKLELPVETQAAFSGGQSYHDKAETLQLHIEQRLLIDQKLLELGRNGFRSHIRAYATHIREERVHFDITELHLGHVAKSFGLREAPGGIGSGIERKTKKTHKTKVANPTSRTGEAKPARDVIKEKSMMLMSAAADEFNIG